MGDRTKESLFIKSLIDSFVPRAKNILELGCGTGSVLKCLSKHYVVSGLDISESMLEIARKTLPGIKLYQQDMVSFSISEKFDVVFCIFDSINHLIEFSDWENVFKHSSEHLKDNGVFIFDINTEYKLNKLASSGAFNNENEGVTLSMKIERVNNYVYNWLIKISEKQADNTLKIFEETIQEVSFSVEKINTKLLEIFSRVDIFDSKLNSVSDTTDRVYFVCHK